MKILLALAMLLVTPTLAEAQIVTGRATLTWNENTETDLAGYRMYQSQVPGVYNDPPVADIPVPIVGTPTIRISALAEDQTFYWVVTAYDTSGNESGFSNEVSKTIFVPPSAPSGLTVTIEIIFQVLPLN